MLYEDILEDYSNDDILYDLSDLTEFSETSSETSDIPEKNKSELDLNVDKDNNLILSFKLCDEIIKNIKDNKDVKIKFLLSKDILLSLLNVIN